MAGQGVIEQRFWSKVRFEGECLVWTGGCDDGGYGQFMYTKAHIWAYEHYVGPVPAEKELDHLCRRRNCVNFILHLEPVTHRENLMRGNTVAARNASVTECRRAHVYTEDNIYWWRGKWRKCRQCNVEMAREWRERQAAKMRERNAPAAEQPQGVMDFRTR